MKIVVSQIGFILKLSNKVFVLSDLITKFQYIQLSPGKQSLYRLGNMVMEHNTQ